MSTYSEMHRENAGRAVALREKIEATGDTDLMRLLEEHDRLWQESEMAREIRSEWATEARRILDATPGAETPSCACDVCAITYALRAVLADG